MTRTVAGLSVLVAWAGIAGADDASRFAGEWKSTFGVVALEQRGDAVTGRFGAGKFPIKGKVTGGA